MNIKEKADLVPMTSLSDLSIDGFQPLYDQEPQLAKVAVGILTWPIAQLSKPNRFKGHVIRKLLNEDQKTAAIEWEVIPDRQLGMPTMLSLRLLFALCKIVSEHKERYGKAPNLLPLPSLNKLCESINVPAVQSYRAIIRRHLEILHNTAIRSKRAFKTKDGPEGISDNFFLVESIKYKGALDAEGKPYQQTFFKLPTPILDSICNDYVKTIDLAFMAEVSNDVAQLLYTKASYSLHKASMQGRNYAYLGYEWLVESMGLTQWKEKRRAKEQLLPAFDALVQAHYITEPEWWVDGSWQIRIRPGLRFEMGEKQQLSLRTAAVLRNESRRQNNHQVSPVPDDERQTTLLRMAVRFNSRNADVDLAALAQYGLTLADVEQKAAAIKPPQK